MFMANVLQIRVKMRKTHNPSDPGLLYYLLTMERSRKLIFTPYSVYPHEWDPHQELIKSEVSPHRAVHLRVVRARIKFDLDRLRCCAQRCHSLSEVAHMYAALKSPRLFFPFMEDAVAHLIELGQFTTAQNYISSYRSFLSFAGYDLEFSHITPELMERYEAELRQRKIRSNTSAFYLRNLRAVYYQAVSRHLTGDARPFGRVFTGIAKTMKRAVGIEDIRRIKALDLSVRPALDFARDAFLFAFYGRGMSMIDVAHLAPSDMHGGYIFYNRSKTRQPLKIKVIPQMQAIIDKYRSDGMPYLLPLIQRQSPQEDREYAAAIRRINNNLKKIGQMAGISTALTTYVARHSWASIGKSKNLPVAVISDSLGHESLSTTEIYLKSLDQASIDAANEIVTAGL